MTARVGVIMGSDSDWPVLRAATEALAEFEVGYEVSVVSAHRTPQRMLDYPLGATDLLAPVVVMANVLGAPVLPSMGPDERLHHLFARFRDAHVHNYGKQERPGRKIGHVTVLGGDVRDLDDVRRRASLAAHWLSHAEWTDGYDIHGG